MQSPGIAHDVTIDVDGLLRRAAPITGWPAGAFLGRSTPGGEDGAVTRRLSQWRTMAAEGSDAAFASRLRWEGLNADNAGSVLHDERGLDAGDEPWAATARKICRRLTTGGPQTPLCAPPQDIPFAPILASLVRFAWQELISSAGSSSAIREAGEQLAEPLYHRLSAIAHRALGVEFRSFRDARSSREGAWSAFEEHMRSGALLGLFERLPVLLRLAATAIALWVEETAEFAARLEEDREAIGRALGSGKPPGRIHRITGLHSDPHRGGRHVRIVRFESGLKVVYKPRSLAIDAAWFGLTAWMSRRTGLELKSPRVLDRGDRGWAEFIGHEPCRDKEAVARYYRRAGHLLCLLYATASTDFHRENLVANGEFPVPIDLETVINPESRPTQQQAPAELQFLGSVLQTQMLPIWSQGESRSDAVDLSALGSGSEKQPMLDGRLWVQVNSDAMEYVTVREKAPRFANNPFLEAGCGIDAGQFVAQLSEGFAEAYQCLMANRAELLSADGPLEPFRGCMTRLVMRPTHVYGQIAVRAAAASRLSCGVDRSLEFEGLSRHYLASREEHGNRRMFRSEVRALEQLDIPYFQVPTDSHEVFDGEGNLVEEKLIQTPGLVKVRQRIANLCEADRSYQLELIRASFMAREIGGPGEPPAFTTVRGHTGPDGLVRPAREIARDIESRAIRHGDEAHWIGYEMVALTGRVQVQPLGPSLYSGLAGVAVFLAAMFAIEGESRYRSAALGAVRTLRRSFLESPLDRKTLRTFFLAGGIGGAAGAGSTIYGLLKTGQLLNDEETVDTALRMSRLIDCIAIREDNNLDVVSGAAGAILALLPLGQHTGDPEVTGKAMLCGERLLETRVPHACAGQAEWITVSRRSLAGFSHGASGIALALLRLHAVCARAEFRDAALAALEFERTLFSPQACNWEDRRDRTDDAFAAGGWCHGAPGVALARIGALRLEKDEDVRTRLRSDLEAGIRYLRRGELAANAIVCCGEMGRVETLIEAASFLKRTDVADMARQRAATLAAGLTPIGDRPFIPGFFHGTAGIGYGLLRGAAPGRLPSILLWE